jgi:hypothetical protein
VRKSSRKWHADREERIAAQKAHKQENFCAATCQHRGYPGRFPSRHFKAKSQSQGNGCQGNGKRLYRIILTIIPLTFLRRFPTAISPSSLRLRRAALGFLRLFALFRGQFTLFPPAAPLEQEIGQSGPSPEIVSKKVALKS